MSTKKNNADQANGQNTPITENEKAKKLKFIREEAEKMQKSLESMKEINEIIKRTNEKISENNIEIKNLMEQFKPKPISKTEQEIQRELMANIRSWTESDEFKKDTESINKRFFSPDPKPLEIPKFSKVRFSLPKKANVGWGNALKNKNYQLSIGTLFVDDSYNQSGN